MVREYGTGFDPAAMAVPPLVGARVPNASLHRPGSIVLYRNHALAASRFGLAVPLSDAPVLVMELATSVVTVGGAEVVNVRIDPNEVPTPLPAMAQ